MVLVFRRRFRGDAAVRAMRGEGGRRGHLVYTLGARLASNIFDILYMLTVKPFVSNAGGAIRAGQAYCDWRTFRSENTQQFDRSVLVWTAQGISHMTPLVAHGRLTVDPQATRT